MATHRFDRDRLTCVNPSRVANAAFCVIDSLDRAFRPEERIAGLATSFILLADHLGVPGQDVMQTVSNVIHANDSDPLSQLRQFDAIRDYLRHETR